MDKCNKCGLNLEEWNRYKDDRLKHSKTWAIGWAIVSLPINQAIGGLFNIMHSNDNESLELYFCKKCRVYYLKCSVCGHLIETYHMPVKSNTVLECSHCHKRIIYDEKW